MPFGFDGIDPRREAEKDNAIWAFIWKFAPAVGLIYPVPIVAGIVAALAFGFSLEFNFWVWKAICWLIGGVALVGGVAALAVGMYLINWIGKIVSAYYIGVGLAALYCLRAGTSLKVRFVDIALICVAASAVTEIVWNFITFFLPGKGSGE